MDAHYRRGSVTFLFGVALILVLGVGAQWLAWQTRLPSILLLLLAGFLAGPVFGVIDPSVLQGKWVYPFVSISIGIILFEGGLNLRLSELREEGGPILNLITIGVLVTWLVGAGAVYLIEDFGVELSLLTGAILVVTGPTVVMPLLREIRPKGRVGAVAKWEGITIDPVGAMLAVLVLEVILLLHEPGGATASALDATIHVATGIGLALGASVVIGGAAAALIVYTLRRRLVPGYLHNPLTLTLVVVAFVGAEAVQHEAGLLTTTLMGLALANQSYVPVNRITEFKENLQVLLLGVLFIVLSARLDLATFEYVGGRTALLIGVLILVVRPLAVFISCVGTTLSWREQAFLGWLAPRGIVAAAVASLFAFDLQEILPQAADALVPVVFMVIVGTVAVYGLTIPYVAHALGLADPNPEGVLFVGADTWVQRIAKTLQDLGITVKLIDSNPDHVSRARERGLDAERGDVLSEDVLEDLDLNGIGRLLITIPNDEVASLAALHLSEIFDVNDIFQLPARSGREHAEGEVPDHLKGHLLFGGTTSCERIRDCFDHEHDVFVVEADGDLSRDAVSARYGPEAFPMFLVRGEQLIVLSEERSKQPRAGDRVVMLARRGRVPEADETVMNGADLGASPTAES
jgi:NhaP-type Na+/H+ or K+/H+ antiporter